jgi:dihydrofolate reductase
MMIRTRMAVSLDGFIATPDGRPVWLAMPGFVPHGSYDWPAFNGEIDAVVMGRVPLDAGMQASEWPWPGKQIYVLTSKPVPADVPADVVVADRSPSRLLDQLRAAELNGDAFLLGGQRTLQAFLSLGAVDRLGLFVLPVLLGDGVPLSPPGAARVPMRLEGHRPFPDGTVEHIYAPV